MKLVADANILFSLARPDSAASNVISSYRIKLISPEYLLSKLEEHRKEVSKKTGQPYEEIIRRLKGLVVYVEAEEYKSMLLQACKMLKDNGDAPYLALAMKQRIPIWSNDRHLKAQESIPVFSTKDLVELLSSI